MPEENNKSDMPERTPEDAEKAAAVDEATRIFAVAKQNIEQGISLYPHPDGLHAQAHIRAATQIIDQSRRPLLYTNPQAEIQPTQEEGDAQLIKRSSVSALISQGVFQKWAHQGDRTDRAHKKIAEAIERDLGVYQEPNTLGNRVKKYFLNLFYKLDGWDAKRLHEQTVRDYTRTNNLHYDDVKDNPDLSHEYKDRFSPKATPYEFKKPDHTQPPLAEMAERLIPSFNRLDSWSFTARKTYGDYPKSSWRVEISTQTSSSGERFSICYEYDILSQRYIYTAKQVDSAGVVVSQAVLKNMVRNIHTERFSPELSLVIKVGEEKFDRFEVQDTALPIATAEVFNYIVGEVWKNKAKVYTNFPEVEIPQPNIDQERFGFTRQVETQE